MSTKERRDESALLHAAHQLNAINWPLVALSALFLSLRIFLKLRQRRPLWWDDYVLIISWLALLISSILFALALRLGYGQTTPQSPDDSARTLLYIYVLSSLLILANLWSKTSFGITLLRLPLGKARIRLVVALIFLGTLFLGASAYLVWIQCLVASPIPFSPYVGEKCLPPSVLISYSVFVGYFSALIDFAFVVLPWKMLWGLEMKRGEKVGVMLAMGMGTLAGTAAVVKSTIFPRVYDVAGDHTAGLQVSGWGAIETSVSICAASIPILRALVRQGGGGGQRVPVGTGEEGDMGRSEQRSVFFQRTWLAPSRTESGTVRAPPVLVEEVGEVEEVLAGKAEVGEEQRRSVEMGELGDEARPREVV